MESFLQTKDWLEFQEYAGRKVWRYDDGKIGANIIRQELPFGHNFLYIPYGPALYLDKMSGGYKNEVGIFFKYLRTLGNLNNSLFVKIEPLHDAVIELIFRRGLKRAPRMIQPHKTLTLDLTQGEHTLLEGMHHKTRYNINLSGKKGLVFAEKNDADAFWELLERTAEKDNFSPHPKEYYKKMMEFFYEGRELKTTMVFAMYEGKPIAGAILMLHGENAYYLHGAMDRDYSKMMAPYFMHWEIIKWAKENGFTQYDFWGVDKGKWPGVTRFKMGFGGRIIEYPGSFDWPLRRPLYFAYKIARKFF